MRNPWPMFCVVAMSAMVCLFFSLQTFWITLAVIVGLLVAFLAVPIRYNDWLGSRINPYIEEYQQTHNMEELEKGLKRWRLWAFTKESRNAVHVNWFCALLQQGRCEEARKELEKIRKQSKTTVDWMNYHLLMAEYAKEIGDEDLAARAQQLSGQLKAKLETGQQNPNETATARQSKQAFLNWLSFVLVLMIGGGFCVHQYPESVLKELAVSGVFVSLLALPVAAGWFVIWMVRRRKEKGVSEETKLG